MNMKPKMVIVVVRGLNMRKGKIAAQVGHACSALFTDRIDPKTGTLNYQLSPLESAWVDPELGNRAKIVVAVDTTADLQRLMGLADVMGIAHYPVIDVGHTEFHGVPTLTCCAFGPDSSENLDPITGSLKLI